MNLTYFEHCNQKVDFFQKYQLLVAAEQNLDLTQAARKRSTVILLTWRTNHQNLLWKVSRIAFTQNVCLFLFFFWAFIFIINCVMMTWHCPCVVERRVTYMQKKISCGNISNGETEKWRWKMEKRISIRGKKDGSWRTQNETWRRQAEVATTTTTKHVWGPSVSTYANFTVRYTWLPVLFYWYAGPMWNVCFWYTWLFTFFISAGIWAEFGLVSSLQDTVVMGSAEYPIEISSGDSQLLSSIESGSQDSLCLELLHSPEFWMSSCDIWHQE